MSPEQQQINELKRQVEELQSFMRSLTNAGQISPDVAKAFKTVIGGTTLNSLSDVIITSPTSGQVLKYNGTNWVNGTDEIGVS